jgi:hypothetical protein
MEDLANIWFLITHKLYLLTYDSRKKIKTFIKQRGRK